MRHEKRVLVVDDYPDTAYGLCRLLSLHGWTCREALDGISALVIASSFAPRVVVTDLSLPDLSGYDLARVLRGRVGGDRLHLAALTARADVCEADSYRAGFDRHVVKPCSSRMLVDAVATARCA